MPVATDAVRQKVNKVMPVRQLLTKWSIINQLSDRQLPVIQPAGSHSAVTAPAAIISSRITCQRGFSLAETLIALLLFALIMTALLDYHQQITGAFHRQWRYRQIWRLASQQTELSPPPLPAGFVLVRQESLLAGCRLITVTVTSRDGLQGQLSRLHCSP